MNNCDLLLTHGLVVTQDPERRILTDAAIAISCDRIAAIGPTAALEARFLATRTIDLAGAAVFPGLINTHTHLFQVAVKGLGEDMPVQDWVRAVTAPTAIYVQPDEMYLFCLTGCLEAIRCGVTTLVDMSYAAHTFALHEANIRAMAESGLRARYSSIISDFGEEYGVLPALIKPIEQFLAEYAELLRRYPVSDRMGIWLAIGAPWTVTDRGMAETRRFADRTGTPLVMHILENEVDNVLCRRRNGMDIVPYLAQTGFLGPDLLAVHCVAVNERDIELLARHRVKVSYNPVSNMYLGSGIPPMMRMAAAGLTIGIGTDGAGSNNSQDMIETLKFASLLQKVAVRDASVVDAQTILDWATLGGAEVLGLAHEIGSLEPGKKADLFVLAARSPKIVPAHDPVASLIYSAGEGDVVMTIADGRILMQDGVIQHVDEGEVLARCQAAAHALALRCGSSRRVKRPWRY